MKYLAAALLLLATHANAQEAACWEYQVVNAPYNAAFTESMVEQAKLFSGAPGVGSPWDVREDGGWLHREHTNFLNEMALQGWELHSVNQGAHAILHYFRRPRSGC